jgi:hypothetical protein
LSFEIGILVIDPLNPGIAWPKTRLLISGLTPAWPSRVVAACRRSYSCHCGISGRCLRNFSSSSSLRWEREKCPVVTANTYRLSTILSPAVPTQFGLGRIDKKAAPPPLIQGSISQSSARNHAIPRLVLPFTRHSARPTPVPHRGFLAWLLDDGPRRPQHYCLGPSFENDVDIGSEPSTNAKLMHSYSLKKGARS